MYKKAYKILRNNMIFIQPVLIWLMVFTFVTSFSLSRIQMILPKAVLLVSMLLLFVACLAGWFYINKYAVLSYNEKDTPEEITVKTMTNFKKFFEGVGSDFIRIFLACIVIILIYSLALYGIYKFCVVHFGATSFIEEILKLSQTGTKEQIFQYVNTISDKDKIAFGNWVITMNIGLSVLNFFAILYLVVMSIEGKNFILSIFKAIKFFVLNIFEAIGIMAFIFVIYLLISIISALFGVNSIIFTLLIIIITLYFNYYILLVFCFYNDKTKKSKINSDNRSEFGGENKSIN